MNEYFCPVCKSPLKISNHIILHGKPTNSNELGGLVLFEPKLGDFEVTTHSSCKMKDGVHMEFYCPVCHENLSAESEVLAHISMRDSDGDLYEIWFAEIMGEQATYKIKAGELTEKYGEDSDKYMNHWGSEPKY